MFERDVNVECSELTYYVMYVRRKEEAPLTKEQRKQNSQHNPADKTNEQRKEGYTGDKKLGGPNRPAE